LIHGPGGLGAYLDGSRARKKRVHGLDMRVAIASFVMPGLNPGIHEGCQRALNFIMNRRAGKLAQPA
jgi:hypothetical protein